MYHDPSTVGGEMSVANSLVNYFKQGPFPGSCAMHNCPIVLPGAVPLQTDRGGRIGGYPNNQPTPVSLSVLSPSLSNPNGISEYCE